jgi:hypothetical protein
VQVGEIVARLPAGAHLPLTTCPVLTRPALARTAVASLNESYYKKLGAKSAPVYYVPPAANSSHEYLIIAQNSTHSDADATCRSLDANLAWVDTAAENQLLCNSLGTFLKSAAAVNGGRCRLQAQLLAWDVG